MSIKNYNTCIIIKELTRGNTEVIHDYFKYNNQLKAEILFQRLNDYLEDNKNFVIEFTKEVI